MRGELHGGPGVTQAQGDADDDESFGEKYIEISRIY